MFFLLVNFWACRRVVFRGVYINYMDYVSTMHLVFTGVYKTVGFGENVFSEKNPVSLLNGHPKVYILSFKGVSIHIQSSCKSMIKGYLITSKTA